MFFPVIGLAPSRRPINSPRSLIQRPHFVLLHQPIEAKTAKGCFELAIDVVPETGSFASAYRAFAAHGPSFEIRRCVAQEIGWPPTVGEATPGCARIPYATGQSIFRSRWQSTGGHQSA